MDMGLSDNISFYNESICNDLNITANCSFTNETRNITSGEELLPPHPLWLTIILGLLAAVIVVVTVAGNILVLLAFALERTIRQPTNYFIASLAVSDLLIGTFSMPCFTLYLLLGRWPLGDIICDLWLSLDWTVCLASQYTVCSITVDRFCSVKIPAKYRTWRTTKKVIVIISVTWIVPVVVFFTTIVGWQYFEGERSVEGCEVQFMTDPLFTFLLTIGYYWITLSVMIGLYIGIYRVALSLQQKANAKQKKMATAMKLSEEIKSKSNANVAPTEKNKLTVENNNPNNPLRTEESTSFTKQPEEDRSSSPAFASDDENSSSQGAVSSHKHHHKHIDIDEDEQTCFVNSAVQTDTTYRPSLKGMLGMSFNHVSKIALSITGTSGSETDTDGNEISNPSKPLIEEPPPTYDKAVTESFLTEKSPKQTDKLLDNDVLQGCKYIEEESLKSLRSTENLKIYPDGSISFDSTTDESCSPVWKRKEGRYMPIPIPEESSYTVSTTLESSNINRNNENDGNKTHRNPANGATPKDVIVDKTIDTIKKENETDKEKKSISSPLHNLVRSMREKQKRSKRNPRKVKSKSENRARKALRTITFILGAYILCWTPYHIMVFLIALCDGYSCINMKLYQFTYWLCYLNSPINPFCYALANQQFKRTFLRILKLDCHKT